MVAAAGTQTAFAIVTPGYLVVVLVAFRMGFLTLINLI